MAEKGVLYPDMASTLRRDVSAGSVEGETNGWNEICPSADGPPLNTEAEEVDDGSDSLGFGFASCGVSGPLPFLPL